MSLQFRKKYLIIGISVIILSQFFFLNAFNSKATQNGTDLTLSSSTLILDFYIEAPSANPDGKLSVLGGTVNYTATNASVTYTDLDIHKYNIYSDLAKTQKVSSGILVWNTAKKLWEKSEIDLLWTWGGKFYVTVEFKTKTMTTSEETAIINDAYHAYDRGPLQEAIITAVLIVTCVVAFAALYILIHLKKRGVSIERKVKETKDDIKVKTLTKNELEQAKKQKKNEKKEKGKTEVKEDLIFSVPQWEVDDDDDE